MNKLYNFFSGSSIIPERMSYPERDEDYWLYEFGIFALLNREKMATAIKKKSKKKLPANAVEIIENGEKKIVSRTWAAALKYRGTGKILDMRAVLK